MPKLRAEQRIDCCCIGEVFVSPNNVLHQSSPRCVASNMREDPRVNLAPGLTAAFASIVGDVHALSTGGVV